MKRSLFVEAIALQFGLAFLITVANWNDFYRTGRYNKIIDSLIEYHPDTDYGIEVVLKVHILAAISEVLAKRKGCVTPPVNSGTLVIGGRYKPMLTGAINIDYNTSAIILSNTKSIRIPDATD